MFYAPEEIKVLITSCVQTAIQPLQEEIRLLRFHLDTKEAPVLSVKEFAKKAGISPETVRNYMNQGIIKYSQKDKNCRVTIATSELLKLQK